MYVVIVLVPYYFVVYVTFIFVECAIVTIVVAVVVVTVVSEVIGVIAVVGVIVQYRVVWWMEGLAGWNERRLSWVRLIVADIVRLEVVDGLLLYGGIRRVVAGRKVGSRSKLKSI